MPITPREAFGSKSKELKTQLGMLKGTIDSELKHRFTGSNSVSVNVPYNLDGWVVHQLRLAYENAGWHVRHEECHDQRDLSASMTFSPKTPIIIEEEPYDPGYPGR